MPAFIDYLLMKSPVSQKKTRDEIELQSNEIRKEISIKRIVLSLIGILFGIFLSFIVTGLEKAAIKKDHPQEQTEDPSNKTEGIKLKIPEKDHLIAMAVISLVICMLSYQQLYSNLRLYENEPTFLILFVSFQYGFFWQAVIKGASTILVNT